MSTLRFASNAKKIKNKPTINLNDKDSQILKLKEEIAKLKQQNESGNNIEEERSK